MTCLLFFFSFLMNSSFQWYIFCCHLFCLQGHGGVGSDPSWHWMISRVHPGQVANTLMSSLNELIIHFVYKILKNNLPNQKIMFKIACPFFNLQSKLQKKSERFNKGKAQNCCMWHNLTSKCIGFKARSISHPASNAVYNVYAVNRMMT